MRSVLAGRFTLFLAFCAYCGPALAQAPADPAFASAKAGFESLDLEARRAIQRDLVWAGGFTGTASGEFGALTFAAIRRFETAARTRVDGLLEAPERAALQRAANAARAEHGFKLETDKPSGMRMGVPTRLLTKRSTNADGLSRWQDAQDKVTLDLQAPKPEDTLEALFAKGTDAKVATRKVSYKLLRPDFFVISGETATGKFYRRMEKGTNGRLHGFAIGYDKALAPFVDPLVIAMASTFEAFPGTRAAPTPGTAVVAGPVVVAAAPKRPRITALVVGNGQLVTSEVAAKACKTLTLDGAGQGVASLARGDVANGLALLTLPGVQAKPLTLAGSAPKNALVIQRDLEGKLLAAPAEIDGAMALAPVQEGGAGAPLFDASGALAGLIISEPVAKYAVAGTLPVLRHRVASAQALAAFAGLAAPGAGERPARSAGEIAGDVGASVVSLLCGR